MTLSWQELATELYAGRDASHDASHAQAVAEMTQSLCATAKPPLSFADRSIAKAAAWLHDVLDVKYSDEDGVWNRDALLAKLQAEGLMNAADAQRAVRVAEAISFSARVARGGQPPALSPADTRIYLYVSDADMLEAMGAIGVIRTCIYQSKHFGKRDSIAEACRYISETLTRCADLMTHPEAKKEAETRLKIMNMMVEVVLDERSWRATRADFPPPSNRSFYPL